MSSWLSPCARLRDAEGIEKFGHVRPEITVDFQGFKFVAIGNRVLVEPADEIKFFTDMLLAYVPLVFGREWIQEEMAKPHEQWHPVTQWLEKGVTFIGKQPQLADGTYRAPSHGQLSAYNTFAYDMYVVEHNASLDKRLVERLKNADQFQGARHELFAAATCLRAGFTIEYEDETDRSSRHAEFTATHQATGQQISVEAKSKHRSGVLGRPGFRETTDELNLRLGTLLNDAVAKNTKYPLVVFLDLNLSPESAHHLLSPRPPHPFIQQTMDRMRKEHGGREPFNLIVFTNHPQHYTKDDETPGGTFLRHQ
jgi:hypothetical protein